MAAMSACLSDLRKALPAGTLDDSLFTLELELFQNTHFTVRSQLEGVWHSLGFKARQLVQDLATFRTLLFLLVESDAVSFHEHLMSLQ